MTIARCIIWACVMAASASFAAAVDLIGSLSWNNLDKYVEALKALDKPDAVNQPDTQGRRALIECSRRKLPDFVEMTLEYGANTSLAEGKTGKTALHYAFANNDVKISQLLMAWGADPGLADKTGTVARDVGRKNKAIANLLNTLDEEGPVAFEDAPGRWQKGHDDEHKLEYFHNEETGKSVWRRPPSCAWTPVTMHDSTVYVNGVTHQTLWHLPRALAWRQIRKANETFWFNFRTNATQSNVPAELPQEMVDDAPEGHYWHNPATGETAWEEPKLSAWSKLVDPEGRTFYFNSETRESSWDPPEDLAWKESHSEEHDRKYWYNEQTKEATWTKPDKLSWTRVDIKDEL